MLTLLSALASLLSFRVRSRASLELELVALRHQLTVLRWPDGLLSKDSPLRATLSPSHRSAACTIATSVVRPEPFAVTDLQRRRGPGVSPVAIAWLGCRRVQNPCTETALQESGALFDSRISPTAIFIDRIPGRMDF